MLVSIVPEGVGWGGVGHCLLRPAEVACTLQTICGYVWRWMSRKEMTLFLTSVSLPDSAGDRLHFIPQATSKDCASATVSTSVLVETLQSKVRKGIVTPTLSLRLENYK